MKILAYSLGLTLFAAIAATPVSAQPLTKTKLVLDWTFEGSHAVFAETKGDGYFEKNNLDVTVDRGYGSGDSIVKVASGAYDFGYVNVNSLIPYNAENPENKLIAVFLVYDVNANSIIARKSAGIGTPKDLEGRKIGAPVNDDSRILFATYAAGIGIDPEKVDWETVESNLRDTLFAQKKVDAIAAIATATINLENYGVPASDLAVFSYGDVLPEILGQGIVVREKTAREKPELVKAFIKALSQGELAAIADPKAAAAKLKLFDELTNVELETKRFIRRLEISGLTPNVRQNGLSYVTNSRVEANVKTISAAFSLSPAENAASLYTDAFLPPREELKLPTP